MEQWATISLMTGGSIATLFFLVRLVEASAKLIKGIRGDPGAPSVHVERDNSPVVTVGLETHYERIHGSIREMLTKIEDTHRIARQSETKLNRVDDGVSELRASVEDLWRRVVRREST